MSGAPRPDEAAATPPKGDPQLSVLLACFAGADSAAKIRRPLSELLKQQGDTILDEGIFRVDGNGKGRVYDPRRATAGALTAALTWGIFGLVAGGGSWTSLVIWAVLGAVCGGLFTYYSVHTLPKAQLGRLAEGMHPDSSAIALFTKGTDAEEVLSSVASHEPTTATLAAIFGDLSARVTAGSADPGEDSAPPADQNTILNMLVVRMPGQHAARQALADERSATKADPTLPRVELLFESDEHGGLKVHSPTWGVHARARSNVISWGLLGLVVGAIASLTGGGGILGSLESGLVTAIGWGVFGLVAGVLYGLWVGRTVSPRRLKGMDALLPPDSSLTLAWAGGVLTKEAIDRWASPESQRLVLRFEPTARGVVLRA